MNRARAIAALRVARQRTARQDADFAGQLFDRQLAFVDAAERLKIARTGRRAGKSTALAAKLLRRLQGRPGRHSLYLTLTRKSAKRILWPAAIRLLRQLKVKHSVSLTDLEIRLDGGGTLILGGIDTQEQVDRWRGDAYQDVGIDECQSFPSDRLQYAREEVVRPALSDYRGDLLMTGTPGPIPAGYWFDLSGDHSRYRVHHWTGLDNPHLPHWAEELAEILEENGWTEKSATYQREYLGLWVLDIDALVYPFLADRNAIDELPTLTPSAAIVDPSLWRYVIVVDVGQVHATGFVVVAAHPALSEDYVVHAEKMLGMQTPAMASRIRDLMVMFPGPVVMDTQGIGKRHADECRSRYGLPIQAADKADKHSGIRIVRDRLLTGQLKAIRGDADPLVNEWRVLVWNKERNDHKREQEDHCADCAIYGVRYLRNYTADHLRPGPRQGSAEWYAQEEQRIWEARRKKMRHGRRSRRWDR